MYNRYIPQPDGSYRRNQVPDSGNSQHRSAPRRDPPAPQKPPQEPQPCEEPPRQTPPPCSHTRQPRPYHSGQSRPQPPKGTGVGTFLKQLLPQNFDTEDLVVILLLLLMSGDCAEDRNTALLTLAIYLFL